ncbi:hypothetical protein DF18_23755 [Streptomyces rimosus]|uniref:Secreted protein n=1 Tax=Streptomyces rimosus subsp. rimosus TaxID=132474 RepID=A0ABY3ZDC5_STRRM|nr:hypothetical protein DF18_23755 [Streptomyces rimosus]KUJ42109.1 hypothetical protein ADK46_04680 [Streptomyces rimosus subsp. rimosus]QDA08782.1 hypothetical protein CTZ40_38555 [Streptomyces rimosus]QEV80060.1 hypothetical protein CP984_38515 [Streptomyces rimosus]UNZ08104.1 hypothetical protein SRIMR7_38700 [Streptomyces rimosus subsp. rimosus]
MVNVPLVICTLTPTEMVVVLSWRSPSPVAVTLPSKHVPGVLVAQRNQAAVPAAAPVVVMGVPASVATPADAQPNAGSCKPNVAGSVWRLTAVFALDGIAAV